MKDNAMQLIKMALAEDIGRGDITAVAIVGPKLRARARIIAKEDLILCGIGIAKKVFLSISRGTKFKIIRRDGERCGCGDVLAVVEGPAIALLSGERTALNFLQHLSGIATLTKRFVDAVRGTRAKILDTRKTLPGWRALEKYAVKTGGGQNHRMGLYDHFLIKNNHIAIAGSVTEAILRAKKKRKAGQKIEVETRGMKEVEEALDTRADIIMLDNMAADGVRRAVSFVGGRARLEVSGNISLENISQYAATGVDFISIGAITHSAPAADVHMLIEIP